MFSFLKKKGTIKTETVAGLALSVFRLMPARYGYVIKQLEKGIITGVNKNDSFLNYIKFRLDVKLLNQYENKKGPVFVIKGVEFYDFNINGFAELNFYVVYGILLGFSTPTLQKINPDINRTNVGKQYLEFFENNDYEVIKKLVSKDKPTLINPNDVYEIELKGKIYYHLTDLEDGDFYWH